MARVCAKCGEKIGKTEQFCGRCGSSEFKETSLFNLDFGTKQKKCIYCSAALEAKAKFCWSCGKPCDGAISLSFIDEKKEEPAPPAPELDFLKSAEEFSSGLGGSAVSSPVPGRTGATFVSEQKTQGPKQEVPQAAPNNPFLAASAAESVPIPATSMTPYSAPGVMPTMSPAAMQAQTTLPPIPVPVGLTREEAEQKAKEQAQWAAEEQRKAEEAAKKAQEEALKKAEEERKAAEEAARKAQEEAEKALEAAKKAQEEAAKKAAEEAAKAAEAAKKMAEIEAAKKAEEERRAAEEAARKAEAERKAAEEAARKAEEEAKRKAEEEARKLAEEEAKRIEEARKKAEEEAKKQAEEAAKLAEAEKKAAEEAAKKAEEEKKAAEEAAKKAEEERKKAEEEAKRKAEEEAKKAEEERRKAEEEAKRKAEEEARKAEEERKRAEEEAKRKAEEEARRAEEERKRAEEEAKRKAEEEARRAEEERKRAEEEAKRKAEEEEAARKAAEERRKELEAMRKGVDATGKKALDGSNRSVTKGRSELEAALDGYNEFFEKSGTRPDETCEIYLKIAERLGVMYYKEKSYKLAEPLVKDAALNGCNTAKIYYVAWMMRNRKEIPAEPGYLKQLLEDGLADPAVKSSKEDKIKATYLLGRIYEEGVTVDKSLAEAFRYYKDCAEMGDPAAMAMVGQYYLYGDGVAKDTKTAFTWNEKAAEAGQERAIRNLAIAYDFGTGTRRDAVKAVEWYKKLLDMVSNDRFAMYRIAYCLADPENEYRTNPTDAMYKEALEYATKALEGGEKKAEYIIGYYYTRPIDDGPDYNKAAAHFNKAANHGEDKAKRWLGRMVKNASGNYTLR